MGPMNTCVCGNPANDNGTTCRRCDALHELGLKAGATDAEVKSAHRLYVKAWHPDRFPGDEKSKNVAQEKLKSINSAYEFLTSPSSKNGQPYRPKAASQPAQSQESSQQNKSSAKQPPPDGGRSQEYHARPNTVRGLQRPSGHVLASILIGCLVLFAIASLNINRNRHAQQNDGPTTDLSQSSNDYQQSSSPASGDAESVIRISAENLLAEFQRSEADKELRIKNESLSTYLNDKTETAEARYTGKRIQVTGIVTGVFIPSIETSRRVSESRGTGITDEQGGAGSFITMGGPYPQSLEETMLLPGIHAWSKTGDSLQPTFGQPNIESLAGRLVVDKEVSILCTFRSSSGSSPTEVSISLEDCILEPSPPLPAPTVPAQPQSLPETAPSDRPAASAQPSENINPGASSASPTLTAEAASGNVYTEVARALDNWAKAHESNDPTLIANCYADQVDRYFLRQNVTNAFVHDYMEAWLKDHDSRVIMFKIKDTAIYNQTPTYIQLRVVKEVVTKDSKGAVERFTPSELSLKRVAGEWKITGERDFK